MTSLDSAAKDTYQLVKFEFEGGGPVAFTDWTSDVVGDDGVTYLSRPNMSVKLPKNTGTFEDFVCEIEMKLEEGFLTNITNGLAFQPVDVTIREVFLPTLDAGTAEINTTFLGQVAKGVRNANKRRNMVRVQALSTKARASAPMGWTCDHQCLNALGDGRCQVVMAGFTKSGVIDAVDGKKLTITVAGGPFADRFFHRGYVKYQGLRIMIREWRSDAPTFFFLVRQPPASWNGATVDVVAGCDKTIETCRAKFDNEEHFNGLGIAILDYDPTLETGD